MHPNLSMLLARVTCPPAIPNFPTLLSGYSAQYTIAKGPHNGPTIWLDGLRYGRSDNYTTAATKSVPNQTTPLHVVPTPIEYFIGGGVVDGGTDGYGRCNCLENLATNLQHYQHHPPRTNLRHALQEPKTPAPAPAKFNHGNLDKPVVCQSMQRRRSDTPPPPLLHTFPFWVFLFVDAG